MVKMGVQYSLWGGSVVNLGTEKHRAKYFDDIDSFRLPGCFAMTELRHGSNVAGLQVQRAFPPHTHAHANFALESAGLDIACAYSSCLLLVHDERIFFDLECCVSHNLQQLGFQHVN
jgi:hypothetical protein